MKKFFGIVRIIGCFVFFFGGFMMFFGLNGRAYIDPSVITYMIQIISGVVISLGAVFGVYGRRIKKAIVKQLGLNVNSHKEVESDDIEMW